MLTREQVEEKLREDREQVESVKDAFTSKLLLLLMKQEQEDTETPAEQHTKALSA